MKKMKKAGEGLGERAQRLPPMAFLLVDYRRERKEMEEQECREYAEVRLEEESCSKEQQEDGKGREMGGGKLGGAWGGGGWSPPPPRIVWDGNKRTLKIQKKCLENRPS